MGNKTPLTEKISVSIDGKQVSAVAGKTILDAAMDNGIEIPHLCHLPGKKESPRPCLLCLVEVDGKRHRACNTTIAQDMDIVVNSQELSAHRKKRLQELASHHYGDCKAPCNLTCPGGINVQGYINLIAKGEPESALRLIKEQNPLPGIVCRVCPRFCESRCRRVLLDEPIAINNLKRFAFDQAYRNGDFKETIAAATNHKIAVIGGGPAGLSCAYYLRKQGHDVTIFEADINLGGMARYGIPDFKMPSSELDMEIKSIINMGIRVRTARQWGRDYNLTDLLEQGFESVFIATGMAHQKQLEFEGSKFSTDGLAFLRRVNSGQQKSIGNKIMIVGGTKVAIEIARSARRLGANDVTIIYPRSKVEMPASQRDINEAEKEGVQFFMMAEPLALNKLENNQLQLDIARTILSEADKKGRRVPVPMEGSFLVWKGDSVINGLGQEGTAEFVKFGDLEAQLKLSPSKAIKSNMSTMATNVSGIFAGGEVASGPRSVIQSVDAGRRAAESIHKTLTGDAVAKPADGRFNFSKGRKFEEVDMENFKGWDIGLREKMPSRSPDRRIHDFDQVDTGFTTEMAIKEAKRCLQCGCTGLAKCELRPISLSHKVPAKVAPTRLQCKENRSHTSLYIDPNKCIACHRCERSCEYDAVSVRYTESQDTLLDKNIIINEKCVSCGACANGCPTGAITKNHLTLPLLPDEAHKVHSVCTYCGTGCSIELHTKYNTIFEVKGDKNGSANHGELCVKGRYGFDFHTKPDRLKQPLLRDDIQDEFRTVSWDEAFDVITEKLNKHKDGSFASLASARVTNEENYLLQKFTRAVMQTNNIDHCARL